ncbi:MAG: hypothetical protein M9934_01660 [Thermomicrobiales bacterium]|nr:hypothetical protein [Thermomicrobiales bacterium]
MFRKLFSIAFIIVIVCNGLYSTNPAIAQDATPVVESKNSTETPVPAASPENLDTQSKPATSQTLRSFDVQPLDAEVINVTLTANGESSNLTVDVNTPISFVATGPWQFDDSSMNLWVYSNPVPANTCSGGSGVSTQGTHPNGSGTSSYSWTPTTSGSYYAYIYWYPNGASSSIFSNCVTITVNTPKVALTANGESSNLTVDVDTPISFVATGPWQFDDSSMNLWVYSNPVPANTCSGGSGVSTQGTHPNGSGTSSYSWTPTVSGSYYAYIYWYPNGASGSIYSNCVTITVKAPDGAVHLTINGSDADREVPVGTSLNFVLIVSPLSTTGPSQDNLFCPTKVNGDSAHW